MCHLSGVGFSTNQIYREDGNRREEHEFEDQSFHFKFAITALIYSDICELSQLHIVQHETALLPNESNACPCSATGLTEISFMVCLTVTMEAKCRSLQRKECLLSCYLDSCLAEIRIMTQKLCLLRSELSSHFAFH